MALVSTFITTGASVRRFPFDSVTAVKKQGRTTRVSHGEIGHASYYPEAESTPKKG